MLIYGKQLFLYLLERYPKRIQHVYLAKECDKKLFAKITKLNVKIERLDEKKPLKPFVFSTHRWNLQNTMLSLQILQNTGKPKPSTVKKNMQKQKRDWKILSIQMLPKIPTNIKWLIILSVIANLTKTMQTKPYRGLQNIWRLQELCDLLGVPRRLSDLGIDSSMIPDLAKDSKGTSMSGNPKELSNKDVEEVLRNIA